MLNLGHCIDTNNPEALAAVCACCSCCLAYVMQLCCCIPRPYSRCLPIDANHH